MCFLMVLPMIYGTNADATTRYVGVKDGSGPDLTGKNVITDPGFCNNYSSCTELSSFRRSKSAHFQRGTSC